MPVSIYINMNKSSGRCPFHKTDSITEFDALDPEARANPYPFYDWLRNDPKKEVYKVPHETDYYMLHRYEDVKNAFTDAENFSSKIIPTHTAPFFALMDGNDHKRIRSVVATVFTSKNLEQWEPVIRKVVSNATINLLNTKEAELFEVWANIIPLGTLTALFGLPHDINSLNQLHRDAIAINRALFVTGGTGERRSEEPSWGEKFAISFSIIGNAGKLLRLRKMLGSQGMKELHRMVRITDKTISTPRPNFKAIPSSVGPMLKLMVAFAEKLTAAQPLENSKNPLETFKFHITKGAVSFAEMMMAGAFILFAGYETTSSLLSNCFVHLARNPELFTELKNDPSKIELFMEESLRVYTPVGRFLRRTKKEVIINGQTIPKDAIVILMSGAANTDPDKFENGCEFDINRTNASQHLSFGKGSHFCIGAPLARMQVLMALNVLIAQTSAVHIVNENELIMVTDRDNGILRYEKVNVKIS